MVTTSDQFRYDTDFHSIWKSATYDFVERGHHYYSLKDEEICCVLLSPVGSYWFFDIIVDNLSLYAKIMHRFSFVFGSVKSIVRVSLLLLDG